MPRGRPAPDKRLLCKAKKMYVEGYCFAEIARVVGGTKERVANWFNKGLIKRTSRKTRTCAIVECRKVFVPRTSYQVCCSRLCGKRFCARRNAGVVVSSVCCALPECQKVVFNARSRRFCCKKHAELHRMRTVKGVYSRLLKRRPCCCVCGEWRVVDEHHLRHTNINGVHRSDKKSRTVWLCPTHHMMIHRGLACFRGVKFHFIFTPRVLRRIGPSWAEAKK